MYVTWREILSLPEPAVITTDMEETWELTKLPFFQEYLWEFRQCRVQKILPVMHPNPFERLGSWGLCVEVEGGVLMWGPEWRGTFWLWTWAVLLSLLFRISEQGYKTLSWEAAKRVEMTLYQVARHTGQYQCVSFPSPHWEPGLLNSNQGLTASSSCLFPTNWAVFKSDPVMSGLSSHNLHP